MKAPTWTLKTLPFACVNCGHKPTAQSVFEHHGDCEKCGDTIAAYTVDTAIFIIAIQRELAAAKSDSERLVGLLDEYIALLLDEINSLVPIAHAHGWESSLVERGKSMRKLIDAARRTTP